MERIDLQTEDSGEQRERITYLGGAARGEALELRNANRMEL